MHPRCNHFFVFVLLFILTGFRSIAQSCAFSLGNDTAICQGLPINFSLLAPTGATAYLWDNSSTLATRTVTNYGTYYCRLTKNGTNVITNGNFSSGNTGFTSSYTLGPTGSPWGVVGDPGVYAITTNASLVHSNFPSFTNHTTGGGNMMVVNGSSTPNVSVWCQNIVVTPNTNYNFSTWAATCVAGSIAELAILQFSINGSVIGSPFSPSLTSGIWSQFNAQWNSGTNVSANICIVNQNVTPSGNDFAIDDIFFQPICVYTDTIKVIPKPFPTGYSAGRDTSLCAGQTVSLSALSGTATAFNWTSIPAGFTSNLLQPLVGPTDTTKYVLSADLNGCKKTDTTTVFIENTPVAYAGLNDTICEGKQFTLQGNAGGGQLVSWQSIPVGFASSLVNPVIQPVATALYVLLSSNGSCKSSDTVEIVVNTSPIADFTTSAADSSCNSYSIQFTNNSTNASSYVWDLGDGQFSSDFSPLHTYTEQSIFPVKLQAKTAGCIDTKNLALKISFSENALFVPNSFSPNNDQKNDRFFIPKGCLQTVSVSIYDRWGLLVKKWEGLEGNWDGKTSGLPASAGVYVYQLDGIYLSGEKVKKKGTITLFR